MPLYSNADLLQRLRAMPAVDPNAIRQTIEGALASAGLSTDSPTFARMFATIDQALGAGSYGSTRHASAPMQRRERSADDANTIDVEAVEVVDVSDAGAGLPSSARGQGQFTTHTYQCRAGSRRYRLYVPAAPTTAPGEPAADRTSMPAIVMLHGCTQNPEDFAAGTQMNRLADEHGFVVIYPEQTNAANPSACWNWFRPQDQGRGNGEPAILAGIVDAVARKQSIDRHRVYVAGLSAGAAMAVVLAHTYPDVFSGVGVHSGLAYKTAHDVPSALVAMNHIAASAGAGNVAQPAECATPSAPVPTIIFHGDADKTVAPANGTRVLERTRAAWGRKIAAQPDCVSGTANGRRYTRQRFADQSGRAAIEAWTIHAAGHAWSGGSRRGSFTDDKGPDASAEMVRFFLALQS